MEWVARVDGPRHHPVPVAPSVSATRTLRILRVPLFKRGSQCSATATVHSGSLCFYTGPTLVRSEASTRWMLQQVNTRSPALCGRTAEKWCLQIFPAVRGYTTALTAGIIWLARYLVDPASSHMLVSKIKPCMSKYKPLYGETADGSLKQLLFT